MKFYNFFGTNGNALIESLEFRKFGISKFLNAVDVCLHSKVSIIRPGCSRLLVIFQTSGTETVRKYIDKPVHYAPREGVMHLFDQNW